MSNVGLKIIKDFKRPPKELVLGFKDIPTSNIADCMNRISAVDQRIIPMNKARLLGTAFTVRVPQGDNLMFHKAMDMAVPGDVIVIDAGGSLDRSIVGELMASYCQKRGLAGIVLDGCIRDADAIAEMDFPVYAIGVTPNGPYKNGPGEINVPVVVGGKTVFPGDIMIGDGDGVVIVRPEDAESLIKEARAVVDKETAILSGIISEGIFHRPWLDQKLKELGYDI